MASKHHATMQEAFVIRLNRKFTVLQKTKNYLPWVDMCGLGIYIVHRSIKKVAFSLLRCFQLSQGEATEIWSWKTRCLLLWQQKLPIVLWAWRTIYVWQKVTHFSNWQQLAVHQKAIFFLTFSLIFVVSSRFYEFQNCNHRYAVQAAVKLPEQCPWGRRRRKDWNCERVVKNLNCKQF